MWRSLGHFLIRLRLPVPVVEPESEPLIESGISSEEEGVEDHSLVPVAPAQVLTLIQLNTQGFQIRLGILPSPVQLRSDNVRWYAVWLFLQTQIGSYLESTGELALLLTQDLSLNGNQFEGIRFRRFRSRGEARSALLQEARKFNLIAAVADRIFSWEYAEGRAERLSLAQL